MVTVVAEKGYEAATVSDAVKLARVSRGTFYELFDSKEACLADAYRLGQDVLAARVSDAVLGARDWREELRLGLRAYLRTFDDEPLFARVYLLEWAPVRTEREDAIRRFARRYGKSFTRAGTLVPEQALYALAAGVHERPARTCARAARQSNSKTCWWAARCGSRTRRSHGPHLQPTGDRLSRRAARLAGRQPARPEPADGGEDAHYAWRRDWQRRLYDAGWAAPAWPTEYGGRGASLTESAIYFEEIGRARVPLPANVLGLLLGGPDADGVGHRRAEGALPVRRSSPAEEIWCQGFSEPEAGSDLAALKTRAVKDGDEWVVTGQKVWTSGAQYSKWCMLVARTDSEVAQAQGPDVLPDGHGAGRRAGAPAAPDHRRGRVQRAVHRGGADPGRERRRRRRQRLEGRADDADERARRPGLRAADPPAPAARRHDRRGRRARPARRPVSPTSSPSCTCAASRSACWPGRA